MPRQAADAEQASLWNRSAEQSAAQSTPLRGLLFEMGGVLYDATFRRRLLLRLLLQHGIHADYGSFFATWDNEYLSEVHCGRREYNEALQSFLLAVGLTWGQIDEVEAANRASLSDLEAGMRLLPGVGRTLPQLAARGLALGVLTNSHHQADDLQERLRQFGLGGLFRTVLSSAELGVAKPEADCYLAALEALQLPAGEVAMVGSSLNDLRGAAALGMRTVAVNHESRLASDVYLAGFPALISVATAWSAPVACCVST